MTVRHLKIFLEVYRNGSITRASERLHMTQPAVTRAIQELEHYYGVRLFDRINRRLLVTEAGKQLYAQALHLVDLFEHMETSLRNWDALGVLRIGSSIALGTHVLPDLILRFRADHPALRTQVTIQNGGALQRQLLDNRLDLALIEGNIRGPGPDGAALPPGPDGAARAAGPSAAPAGARLHPRPSRLRPPPAGGGQRGARAYLDHVFAVHGLTVQPAWESASTQAPGAGRGQGPGYLSAAAHARAAGHRARHGLHARPVRRAARAAQPHRPPPQQVPHPRRGGLPRPVPPPRAGAGGDVSAAEIGNELATIFAPARRIA